MSKQKLAQQIAAQIEAYLAAQPACAVMEGGALLFDLRAASYSVTEEGGDCLLHLWSEERNLVRRIAGSEIKAGTLRLAALRFGSGEAVRLDFCPAGGRCTPAALRTSRGRHLARLPRLLARLFPGWTLDALHAAGPGMPHGNACLCGFLQRGLSGWAVTGCCPAEPQATLDESVTTALLWFDHCRKKQEGRRALEGMLLFLPKGGTAAAQLRMAHLRKDVGRWRLFAVDEETEEAVELDPSSAGNLETRLGRCFDPALTLSRLPESVARIGKVLPQAEAVALNTAEIEFRLHGLAFARARLEASPEGFGLRERLRFGLRPQEQELTPAREAELRLLAARLLEARHRRHHANPLYRTQSERWLESVVRANVSLLDGAIDPRWLYAQVPAIADAGRAMIDLLGITRAGRLVVIELKAEEDAHLPLQGLDYWARVDWLQKRGSFAREGYFAGREIAEEPPLLLLVAPSLHLHPQVDTVLRYLSPEVDWRVKGLDEHWRDRLRIVFQKSPAATAASNETTQE
jgi:hypothetical protein